MMLPYAFLYFVFLALLGQSRDMDSEADIRHNCTNPNPKGLWWEYVCSRVGDADGWNKCWPQRRYSRCSGATGVVAFFHGYSACPDAYNEMASVLQDACFHVYTFTSPGHGNKYVTTGETGDDIIGKYNLSGLPKTRQGYLDFADQAIQILQDEISKTSWQDGAPVVVGAVGLSLGAPIATAVTIRSTLFSHLLLFSPFFGVSTSGLDVINARATTCLKAFNLQECVCEVMETVWGMRNMSYRYHSAICGAVASYVLTKLELPEAEKVDWDFQSLQVLFRGALEWIAEESSGLSDEVRKALDSPIGWGAKCDSDVEKYNRGGFCKFKVQHLLAAHSLGQYIVRESYNRKKPMKVFMSPVERDGPTRNGLAFQVLRGLASTGSSAQACMWQIAAGCEDLSDNTCGVPHSSASTSDNLGAAPHFLYWNETQRLGLASFLTGAAPPAAWNAPKWDGSRDMCVALDVESPPRALISYVPSRLEIILKDPADKVRQQGQELVLNGLATLTGINASILRIINKVLSNEGVQIQRRLASGTTVISLMLPESAKHDSQLLFANVPKTFLDESLAVPIGNVSMDGRPVQLNSEACKPCTPATEQKPDNVSTWTFVFWMLVQIAVTVFATISAFYYGHRKGKSSNDRPPIGRHGTQPLAEMTQEPAQSFTEMTRELPSSRISNASDASSHISPVQV